MYILISEKNAFWVYTAHTWLTKRPFGYSDLVLNRRLTIEIY